jgi:hypothetical protein
MLMTLGASYVIAHWGWRAAYLAFAAPVFLIVIPWRSVSAGKDARN